MTWQQFPIPTLSLFYTAIHLMKFWINNHHMHYFLDRYCSHPMFVFLTQCHCLRSSTKMSPSPASEVVAIVLLFDFELMEVLLQLKKLNLADQPVAPAEKNKCLLLLF